MPEILNLAAIRKNYCLKEFTQQSAASNPIKQFDTWMKEAIEAQVNEPTAMLLATATLTGKPSTRIVLLKGFDDRGFVFFTNYSSRKGREIAENPQVAITFFWPELERQVRIEGKVRKVDPSLSDEYFQSRPLGSRIGAWASPQSQVIESREFLERADAIFTEKFKGCETIPRPEHWGGYVLEPEMIEFWQGRPNRLHDRLAYEITENGDWQLNRLAP